MTASEPSRVAIVIPALNEALAIRDVVSAALRYCPDVFVIDDGSSDGTSACIADLPIRLIRHETRMGKGRSLKDGMQAAFSAGFDAVISIDGDGQHSSEDVPRLLRAHAQQPRSLLLCARLIGRESQPAIRRFANHFADFWVSWACGQRILDSQCGQRLYPRQIMAAIQTPATHGFAFESEVLINASQAGFAVVAVPIRARYHAGRRASHFQPLRDVGRITRMIFWKIVFRGLALPSLFRSLFRPALQLDP
jgi:glycosyltransferase involved in cell wall biosynthesis